MGSLQGKGMFNIIIAKTKCVLHCWHLSNMIHYALNPWENMNYFTLVLHYFWSLQCLKTVFFFLHWEHLKASMIES